MLQYLVVCSQFGHGRGPPGLAAPRGDRDVLGPVDTLKNCTFCEKLHYTGQAFRRSQPSTSNSALNRRQSHSQRDGSSPIPAPPHATKSKMSV